MRALPLFALLFLLAACAASQPSATGTIQGHVLASPCTPVERLDSPCPGLPVAAITLTLVSSNGDSASATTDAAGFYSIHLAPGRYTINLPAHPPSGQPQQVTLDLAAGKLVTQDFHIDSGIR